MSATRTSFRLACACDAKLCAAESASGSEEGLVPFGGWAFWAVKLLHSSSSSSSSSRSLPSGGFGCGLGACSCVVLVQSLVLLVCSGACLLSPEVLILFTSGSFVVSWPRPPCNVPPVGFGSW